MNFEVYKGGSHQWTDANAWSGGYAPIDNTSVVIALGTVTADGLTLSGDVITLQNNGGESQTTVNFNDVTLGIGTTLGFMDGGDSYPPVVNFTGQDVNDGVISNANIVVAGTLTNNDIMQGDTINVDGGRLFLDADIQGGTINISSGTLEFGGYSQFEDFHTPVDFTGSTGTLTLDGFSNLGLSWTRDMLVVTGTGSNGSQGMFGISLNPAGSYSSDEFQVDGSSIVYTQAQPSNPSPGTVQIIDATTGQTTTAEVGGYVGTVAGLTSEFVYPTSDQVSINSLTPNIFIQLGRQGGPSPAVGAINVSQANGNNVLDSYANSSFLTDGAGTDQNYVDARALTANQWDTVVNFHSGDNVTIWGVTPQDFSLNWIGDTQGAAGATGLTGVYVPDNSAGHAVGITLTGYSMADATNGRLAITYDTIDGAPYASIHAT